MIRTVILALMVYVVSASAEDLKLHHSAESEVVPVATALDHLTVIEFGEPVTMAAAGSADFQVERHETRVFVKPLKVGASTDLFVWTASRRFAYELESPGEVKNMNFAVDSRMPAPTATDNNNRKLEEAADGMLTRAFLAAERVDSAGIKDDKRGVTVRIEQVYQSTNSVYIQYSIRNRSMFSYRAVTPAVSQALAPHSTISLTALEYMQVDGPVLHKMGKLIQRSTTPSQAVTREEDLRPGEETQGVIEIPGELVRPAVFQLTFAPSAARPVQAWMVF